MWFVCLFVGAEWVGWLVGGVERREGLVGWMDGWIQIPEHIKYVMSTWALFA